MSVQSPGTGSQRIPGKVKWAIAGLWFEVVVFALGIFDVFMQAHSKSSHGQEGAAQLVVGGVFLLPMAGMWVWCAIVAARRAYWARLLAAILQAFFILSGLLTLVIALASKDPIGAVVALVLFLAVPIAIASLMLSRGPREWFDATRAPTFNNPRP